MNKNLNISLEIKGGLGNLLFQISTGYSCSLENNANFSVDVTNYYGFHKSLDNYKNNILRKVNFTKQPLNLPLYNEKGFDYTELPKFETDVKLSGYFQSEKYFQKYKKEILDLFEIDELNSNILKTKYDDIFTNFETVSLHVRRGDYLHLQHVYFVLDLDYYRKCYECFGEEKMYLLFSDDPNWCRDNMDFIKNKQIIDLDDYLSLYLMSLCKDNIIANSSFSWWGAWLNRNESKTVLCPNNWFKNPDNILPTKDLYCSNWKII